MVRGQNDERATWWEEWMVREDYMVRGLNDEREVYSNMVRGLHGGEWDYMVRWRLYDEVTIW